MTVWISYRRERFSSDETSVACDTHRHSLLCFFFHLSWNFFWSVSNLAAVLLAGVVDRGVELLTELRSLSLLFVSPSLLVGTGVSNLDGYNEGASIESC